MSRVVYRRVTKTFRLKRKSKSIAKLRDEVWKFFSIYIRAKDADWKGLVSCVTCGKRQHWRLQHAGHFIPGRRPSILFDERGVHPQCPKCNVYLHGNLISYYPFMQQTYGEEVIEELKKLHYQNKQFTAPELIALRDKYKDLVKKYL